MKTEEDEAFDELARKQGAWGGGFPAKRAMAADKLQEPAREALKLALEALENPNAALRAKERLIRIMGTFDLATGHADTFNELLDSLESELRDVLGHYRAAVKEHLAQPAQEPVAWKTMEAKYPSLEKLDIRMGDGSILCDVWPQSDGDFWWAGSGTGEKFIDPKYADVTHWRVHSDTAPPQREWVGLTAEEIASIPLNEYTLQTAERLLKEKNT